MMTLYARRFGKGTPVVLLHGFTGSHASWLSMPASIHHHHQVITPDLIGHGLSPAPDDPAFYTVEAQIGQLHALLDMLSPQPFHLLGYSMGGRLALAYALAYPHRIRTLALESSTAGIQDPAEREQRRASDEALASRILQHGIEAFVAEWERLPLWNTQTDTQRTELRLQRLAQSPIGLAHQLRGFGAGVQPTLWHQLGQITYPTLLLVGELDSKYLAIGQALHQALPHSQLEVAPNAGHTIHLEQKTWFWETMGRFWQHHAV